MSNQQPLKKEPTATLSIEEKWCDSYLVNYPVSYRYNGGILIDGEWYGGYDVPRPIVPEGFKLKNIGVGLQMNARPPYATMYLEPLDGHKVTKKELKALLQA